MTLSHHLRAKLYVVLSIKEGIEIRVTLLAKSYQK